MQNAALKFIHDTNIQQLPDIISAKHQLFKGTFFYIRDIIYNLYEDKIMRTYSQLKKICVTPQGDQWRLLCPKLYASSGIDISKCIEGGSMKLTTLVNYIYVCVCVQSRMHFHVMHELFLNVFIFFNI